MVINRVKVKDESFKEIGRFDFAGVIGGAQPIMRLDKGLNRGGRERGHLCAFRLCVCVHVCELAKWGKAMKLLCKPRVFEFIGFNPVINRYCA